MGASTTLERPISDVQTLPFDALERRLALPILVRLRLEILADLTQQTTIDREFLMTTEEIGQPSRRLASAGVRRAVARARGAPLIPPDSATVSVCGVRSEPYGFAARSCRRMAGRSAWFW